MVSLAWMWNFDKEVRVAKESLKFEGAAVYLDKHDLRELAIISVLF